MILEWRNSLNIRKWMLNKNKILLNDRLEYINSLKNKDDKKYYLVKFLNNPIGVIDFTNIKDFKANIGIYSNPYLKGVGKILMQEILQYGKNILKLNTFKAEVFEDNKKAIELYKKFGFVEIDKVNNLIIMELNI